MNSWRGELLASSKADAEGKLQGCFKAYAEGEDVNIEELRLFATIWGIEEKLFEEALEQARQLRGTGEKDRADFSRPETQSRVEQEPTAQPRAKAGAERPAFRLPRKPEPEAEPVGGTKPKWVEEIMEVMRAKTKSKPEPEPEPGPEPETEAEPEPQADVGGGEEDDTNPANNIRRKLWRMGEALKWIKTKGVELPVDKVGSAICWLAGPDEVAGRACFVECFGEVEGGKAWAAGFPRAPGSVNEIYTVAQRLGWRYPIAVNLNRLDRMVQQTEAALMRASAEIYQAGNELVRPVRAEVQATKGRKTVVAVLVKIDHAFLKTELTRLIDFFNWKGEVRNGAAVPNDVVKTTSASQSAVMRFAKQSSDQAIKSASSRSPRARTD
jgi:hypothetical protein